MSNNNLGTLFLVATPIGNLNEVSPRTIETLNKVEIIACEDTRNTRKLLTHFDIHKKLFSYHNFNEKEEYSKLIDILKQGQDVALVSDAGYPLISDPGYVLVNEVIKENINIVTISGPSAGINALVASGLKTNHYMFYGFLNAKDSAARKELQAIKAFPYTIIFYEAPHRINKTLKIILDELGDRHICIARELTKIHEEFLRGKVSDFLDLELKGEIVILIEGQEIKEASINDEDLIREVKELITAGKKTKEAVKEIATKYQVSKNDLYNKYLKGV